MKLMKSLLAVSVIAGAAQAQAVQFNVTGTLLGQNTVGATADPTLVLHAGSTAYSTTGQTLPTFTGLWDLFIPTLAMTGTFSNFQQYSTSVNAGLLGGTAVVNQPNNIFNFNGGTVAYNSATRTMTLGQAMTWSATDSAVNNNQTSDASLSSTGTPGVCTGSSTICNGQSTWFLGSRSGIERFYLTLTFSSDFQTFTGSAVGGDVGGALPLGNTGNTWYNYSFSGTAVPVPAAAWLFGSGLIGLAGAARRRRSEVVTS